MTKRLCSYPRCDKRRAHHEHPNKMRKHRIIEVPDNVPLDYPYYCSMTCAISDGYMVLYYETPEQEAERQRIWRENKNKDI
jgi:hypothetical protein